MGVNFIAPVQVAEKPEELLTDDISEFIIGNWISEQEKRGPKSYFYVSDLGYCPRKLLYSFRNIPCEPFSDRALRIFACGDSFHERMNTWFKKMGVLVAEEYPFQVRNGTLHGRIDSIVAFNSKKVVVELKSINTRGFRSLKRPKHAHHLQIQLYMWYLLHHDNTHSDISDVGKLIYEDKDTQQQLEFDVKFNADVIGEIFQFMNSIERHKTDGTLPLRMYEDCEAWQCRYCNYSKLCWKDETGADYGEFAFAKKYED